MRRANWLLSVGATFLIAGLCCTSPVFGQQPSTPADNAKKRLESLLGTWVGVSYEFGGKANRPLKRPQGPTLRVRKVAAGYEVGFWRNRVEALPLGTAIDFTGGISGGEIEFKVAAPPFTVEVAQSETVKRRLAIDFVGDQMRLRDLINEDVPQNPLVSKEGDNWIIFTLKRVDDNDRGALKELKKLYGR